MREPLPPIPFAEIVAQAVPLTLEICQRWLPGGRVVGREYTVINPTRADRKPGSFRVNIDTGAWADFAVPDARGRDAISLGCYLFGWSRVESARHVARLVGHPFGDPPTRCGWADSQPDQKPDNTAATDNRRAEETAGLSWWRRCVLKLIHTLSRPLARRGLWR